MVEIDRSTVPTAMGIDEIALEYQDAWAATVALKHLSATLIAPPRVKSNLADGGPFSPKGEPLVEPSSGR